MRAWGKGRRTNAGGEGPAWSRTEKQGLAGTACWSVEGLSGHEGSTWRIFILRELMRCRNAMGVCGAHWLDSLARASREDVRRCKAGEMKRVWGLTPDE